MKKNTERSLYVSEMEHDSCGIGFVANLRGHKSHKIIKNALEMLRCMEHRGATGCEPNTGDGAGIMMQVPHEFFVGECLKLGIKLPAFSKYAVGMIFFPRDEELREDCREILERNAEKFGFEILGYREVPTNNSGLGESAKNAEPHTEQVFVKCPDTITDPGAFERKLFVLRNYITRLAEESVSHLNDEFYFVSLSYKTIVYKGQLTTYQVESYYKDLQDKRVISAIGVIHSRFATNTVPCWKLAQPLRYITHNGEINTIKGNVNWLKANEFNLFSEYFTEEEMQMILPICRGLQSDSGNLDNIVEMLTLCGRSLPHAMMMLIPEAWDDNKDMDEVKKAFYEYHACLMEPWDGPASISFTDGVTVGATLDRNGLRPSRYLVTDDDMVVMGSEIGVLDIDPSHVVETGRLQPGKMFVADLHQGRIISDNELKLDICSRKPYGAWLEENKIRLDEFSDPVDGVRRVDSETLMVRQIAFGYTSEDLKRIIAPMSETSKEPIGSMGQDTPLAILSDQAQHLSNYFKQLFAQVTNPPIDPIRERLVMSLTSYIGNKLNILEESPAHCHMVALKQPILTTRDLEKLRFIDSGHFQTKTIQSIFRADEKPGSLKDGLDRICRYASDAVEDNYEVIVLSDRSIGSDHAPIPSLLATAAVHHHLIRKGQRAKIGIVVEAGDAWETHHFATLLGFGAQAINPYLAYTTIREMKDSGIIKSDCTDAQLIENYIQAIGSGLLKIFSKMGISTLQSYQGSQIFEIIGINKEVVNKYFCGTISRIEGLDLEGITKEILAKHKIAFPDKSIPYRKKLQDGGMYQWKRKGEFHLFNPDTVHLLQYSTRMNDFEVYKKYAKAVNDQNKKAVTLRSLLEFTPKQKPIPISQVEPANNLFKRLATGAMSFGSISYEAHSTLAIAMNRIGGKSNTGEGGEDDARYTQLENGDSARSAIKQVASGRFGVTANYLANSDEIQIKMAQGAKPGEGGQLPGYKVDNWIGRVRHSTPGVGLISPPPHHDVYSIEDLAQLIYDLKNANRKARINVKLVSEAGVGTVASGVAKAHADVILISGHDGGTGASPLSSIRHAGLPWELGVAETQQSLVMNKLRGRVVLQADGQMKTGRDLAIATLLGAEEWGIATAALIVEGCIMMRKCHLNTCPVGIATQDKELRKRYTGSPDHVVNFFKFLIEDLREIMAELGYRTINEMVGQAQNLSPRENINHCKYKKLDLMPILYKHPVDDRVAIYNNEEQNHGLDSVIDWKLVEAAKPALKFKQKVEGTFKLVNTDRAVGTILTNEITKIYGSEGLPEHTVKLKFEGHAGQSFAAFATKGLLFEMEGDVNDYCGKGLSGAKIIIYPSKKAGFVAHNNIILGNVAFYGATDGEAFIRGMAGERFCVRNSGAHAIIEGLGDHGCEYMTGGRVIVLGETGRNFAAGMSGGIAYVYNATGKFEQRVNFEMIDLEQLNGNDQAYMKEMIAKHHDYTGSDIAKKILKNWDDELRKFIKVIPRDYRYVLQKMEQEKKKIKY